MTIFACLRFAHANNRHNGNDVPQRLQSIHSWFIWNTIGKYTNLLRFSRCRWDMQVQTCSSLHGLRERMQTRTDAEVRGFVPVGHNFISRSRCRGPRRFLRTSANWRLSIAPRTNMSNIRHKFIPWSLCKSSEGDTHGNMCFNFPD